MNQRLLVAITGASGAPYAAALLRRDLGDKYLVLSQWGRMVLREETGLNEDDLRPYVKRVFSDKDLANPFASGSNAFDAMVVVPCSLSTMAKIAVGIADKAVYFEVFQRYCIAPNEPYDKNGSSEFVQQPAPESPTYKDIARKLNLQVSDVRNYLTHCRATLRSLIKNRVRDTVTSEPDLETELRQVLGE